MRESASGPWGKGRETNCSREGSYVGENLAGLDASEHPKQVGQRREEAFMKTAFYNRNSLALRRK